MSLKSAARILVAAISAAAVIGGGSLTVAAAGPAIALKPASGPPTSTVKVVGSGFGVTEAVDVYFDTTDMVLASTDGTGAFSIGFRAPSSAQPGTHYVTAIGRNSHLSAQKVFTVRTDWTQFRDGARHLGQNPYENTLSSANVPGLQESWVTGTAGGIHSSPAVVNGIVYIGSNDNHIYALNASTGAVIWTVTTGNAVQSSPAVVGGVAYVGSEDGKVYALNSTTGSTKWVDDLSSLEPSGFGSSPSVAGGRVYIGGNSGNVYSLDAATGFSYWVFPAGSSVESSPTVANGVVFIDGFNGTVYAVNATSGSQIWKFATACCTTASPAVVNGAVYVGAGDGTLHAINAFTGTELWNVATGVTVLASVMVANGTVYLTAVKEIFAFAAATGALVWTSFDNFDYSSPAVANGVVYVGTGSGMVAVSSATGSLLWTATHGLGADSSPAVVDGQVYIGSRDGSLYAYALPVPPAAVARPNPSALHPNLSLKQGLGAR
jgi:outer membrane protein assembly factor BamB